MDARIITDLNSQEWLLTRRLAEEGTEEQRDAVMAWAWSNVPAELYEELARLAGREYLLD